MDDMYDRACERSKRKKKQVGNIIAFPLLSKTSFFKKGLGEGSIRMGLDEGRRIS